MRRRNRSIVERLPEAPHVLRLERLRRLAGQADAPHSESFPTSGSVYLIRDDPDELEDDELTAVIREVHAPHTYRLRSRFRATFRPAEASPAQLMRQPNYPGVMAWVSIFAGRGGHYTRDDNRTRDVELATVIADAERVRDTLATAALRRPRMCAAQALGGAEHELLRALVAAYLEDAFDSSVQVDAWDATDRGAARPDLLVPGRLCVVVDALQAGDRHEVAPIASMRRRLQTAIEALPAPHDIWLLVPPDVAALAHRDLLALPEELGVPLQVCTWDFRGAKPVRLSEPSPLRPDTHLHGTPWRLHDAAPAAIESPDPWAGFAGFEALKERVDAEVIAPLMERDAFAEHGVTPPAGVLLIGPPGCGKSLLASAIAAQPDVNGRVLLPADLTARGADDGAWRLHAAFHWARRRAPSVLVLDDLDRLVRSAQGTRLLDELLAQTERSAGQPLVVATAADPRELDPALIRAGRFDSKLLVLPPTAADREAILQHYLAELPTLDDDHGIDTELLAAESELYTPADLAAAVRLAARRAVAPYEARLELGTEQVRRAFLDHRRSLTPEAARAWLDGVAELAGSEDARLASLREEIERVATEPSSGRPLSVSISRSHLAGGGAIAAAVATPSPSEELAPRARVAEEGGPGAVVEARSRSEAATTDASRETSGSESKSEEVDLPDAGGVAESVPDAGDDAPPPLTRRSIQTELVEYYGDLGERHSRLLVRLQTVTGKPATFQHVLSTDAGWFGAQQGVGRTYVDGLVALQREILAAHPELQPEPGEATTAVAVAEPEPEPAVELPSYPVHLHFGMLHSEERKAHAKLARILEREPTVRDLLDFSPSELAEQGGVGRKTLRALEELRGRVCEAVGALEASPTGLQRGLLVVERPELFTLGDIDGPLVEDVDAFVSALDDQPRDVLSGRTGYRAPRRELRAIGEDQGVSRERVRQIESALLEQLPRSLRIHPNVVRSLVDGRDAAEVAAALAGLAGQFDERRHFLRFVELCAGVEPGHFFDASPYAPPIPPSDVDGFFVEEPAPVPRPILLAWMESKYGVIAEELQRFVDWLIEEGRLAADGGGVRPRALTLGQAVAHVLVDQPVGLPWRQIAELVNERECTRSPMDTARSASHFQTAPRVYLYGSGRYRHLRFFDLSGVDIGRVLDAVGDLLRSRGVDSGNLQNIHHAIGAQLKLGYFELRHLVSAYGEEAGLYFTGASRVDTVALRADGERVPLVEAVYRMIADSDTALSHEEVTARLHSRNGALAHHLLSQLVAQGRIGQAQGGSYQTTERLHEQIDVERLTAIIEGLLSEQGPAVVDADVLRERANRELRINRGRDFYVALLRGLAKERGWHVRRTLFSRTPVPWNSLTDVVRSCVQPDRETDAVLAEVRAKVRLTELIASTAVRHAIDNSRASAAAPVAVAGDEGAYEIPEIEFTEDEDEPF